jgi:hypothetical protein
MSTLFTPDVVASLAHWQRTNMPDRALVFVRSLTRAPGGVSVESYTYAWTDACRLSQSRATEGNQDGSLTTGRVWQLVRPSDARPLDGSERVLVQHAKGGATLVRLLAEAGTRTYQTVRKSDATSTGVARFTVATTRVRGGPVPLRWSTSIAITTGS